MPSSSSFSVRAVSRQYLWQEPYAVVLQVRICAEGGGQLPSLPRPAYVAMLAFVLLFAYGFYRLFEAHTGAVRRVLKKLLRAKPQPGLRAI